MKKYLSRLLTALLALALLAVPASALTVDQALELLEDYYYYDIPEAAYQADSLDQLFQLLGDPYTEYMTEEQYAAFQDAVDNTVNTVGIGVSIQFTDEGILVLSTLDGGSALDAGLQAGDLIVAIDGASCVPANETHQALMLGQEGTLVTITVLRGGETRDYTLTRRAIYIPNTQISLLDGGVGYVDCNSFGSDTGKLFAQGLQAYDNQVDCWILDLRGNGGGYVDAAADMLAALSGTGHYLYFVDKDGQVGVYARSGQASTHKPLLLLVDGSSASASEAVASSVRDMGRGFIIGSRTFGKGVGQTVLDEDSAPGYFNGDILKLTTGRFYSYGGNSSHYSGVIPTLLVDDAYAGAVADALCGGNPATSNLCVQLGPHPFYVDPNADQATLSALLEAIPPQVPLFCRGVAFDHVTPAQAADRLGLDYQSRWFTDVSDSFYANSINALGTYGLLSGTGGGKFAPKEQLTRAQLCTTLAQVLGVSSDNPSRFSDVSQNSWYGPSVNAMAELGLVNGMGNGQFYPNRPVTQEQFLTILGRTARYLNFALDAYGDAVDSIPSDSLPPDVQLSLSPYQPWAQNGVAVLAWGLEDALGGHGNLLYTSLRTLTPSDPILREEAAAGIYALLSRLEILP